MNGQGNRLAGLVLACLGVITYGTTSPFGLVLSAEKLFESGRPTSLKVLDWCGVVMGAVGTAVLPVILYGMWTYSLIGPWPVCAFLYGFAAFLLCRKRLVWPTLRPRPDGA